MLILSFPLLEQKNIEYLEKLVLMMKLSSGYKIA